MDKNRLPIGFYDSGVGGISVLREAMRLLPKENFIYYGDNANAPYGSKDEEEVKELSLKCGDFLFGEGVKAIVIACNTATSIVVQTMREKYNIPVVSMEPAVKPAAEACAEGNIAVMATPATLHQKRYHALVERLGIGGRVVNVECGRLAALIEEGDTDSPHIKAHIHDTLYPYRESDIRSIVIGCTHYSFVRDKIEDVARKIFRRECGVFDGMYGTARHVKRVLEREGILNDSREAGRVKLYSSKGEAYREILEMFIRLPLEQAFSYQKHNNDSD